MSDSPLKEEKAEYNIKTLLEPGELRSQGKQTKTKGNLERIDWFTCDGTQNKRHQYYKQLEIQINI